MKYEWRKQDKNIYLPKAKPEIIDLEPMTYITIQGKGNPNHPLFSALVTALYATSYAIKMMPKKGETPEGYYDYTVFPLEGFWSLEPGSLTFDKEKLTYKIMLRQPDFITPELFEMAKEKAAKKVAREHLDQLKLEEITEGLNLQMLHMGSFDDEEASFAKMEAFCEENNLERLSKNHKEIYLSDFKKVAPEKLKTTLRFEIKYK
ncbi:GyrI-like domain-containing protein [Listeria rocourtiae]|uniref:GyrI-like domain-containing protein n=1 Tax=Listeria rocourtiae TaxID=647910 RepID=UPI003D2F91EA